MAATYSPRLAEIRSNLQGHYVRTLPHSLEPDMKETLAVILVNYRSAGLLLDALGSLFLETGNIALEVWVVDNASGDDSRARILEAFPSVHWIDMGYNAGFARANNAGIRAAGDKDVLLLNP